MAEGLRALSLNFGDRLVDMQAGSCMLYLSKVAEVAEWQTRRIQNPMPARVCGFESHLRYYSISDRGQSWSRFFYFPDSERPHDA